MKLKKQIFLLAILLFSASCSKPISQNITPQSPSFSYSHKLQVGNKNILVEIADTPQKMEQGLSGRPELTDDQGMLFDFKTSPNPYLKKEGNNGVVPSFWMKDMKFNLDFIWINNNKIIGITPDVLAPIENSKLKIENLPTYFPPSPVTWVLEINSGWAKKNHLQVGDGVKLVK